MDRTSYVTYGSVTGRNKAGSAFLGEAISKGSRDIHGPRAFLRSQPSMTAALAVGAATGLDFDGSLRLAAAAGVLNISRHGLGTGRRDAITEIAKRVELIDLP